MCSCSFCSFIVFRNYFSLGVLCFASVFSSTHMSAFFFLLGVYAVFLPTLHVHALKMGFVFLEKLRPSLLSFTQVQSLQLLWSLLCLILLCASLSTLKILYFIFILSFLCFFICSSSLYWIDKDFLILFFPCESVDHCLSFLLYSGLYHLASEASSVGRC